MMSRTASLSPLLCFPYATIISIILAHATSATTTCETESVSVYNKTADHVTGMRDAYETGCDSSCITTNEPFFMTQVQNFTGIGKETDSLANLRGQCRSQNFLVCNANMNYKASTENPFMTEAVVELNVKEIDKPVCVPKSCKTEEQVFQELLPYTNIACTLAEGRQCEFYEQTLECEGGAELGTVVGQCADDLPGLLNPLSINRGILSTTMNLLCAQSTIDSSNTGNNNGSNNDDDFCRTTTTNGVRKEIFDFTSFVLKKPDAYAKLVTACEESSGEICHADFELKNTPTLNGVVGLLDLHHDYVNYPVCLSSSACGDDDNDNAKKAAAETLVIKQITSNVGIEQDIPNLDLEVPNPTADECDVSTGLCEIDLTRLDCGGVAAMTKAPTKSPAKDETKTAAPTKMRGGNEENDNKGDDGGDDASSPAVTNGGVPSLVALSVVTFLSAVSFVL